MSEYEGSLCLISLGCNKNLVDSEVMLGRLRSYRLIDEPSEADIIIVNTCGFIASAKQESINKILEVGMGKKSGAILVVSGCLSERYASELREEIKEIDIITGVGEYGEIDRMIRELKALREHSSLGNHFIDLLDFRELTDSSLVNPLKFSKNYESTTANIGMLGGGSAMESLESSVESALDSRDSTTPKNTVNTPKANNKVFLIDNEERVITGSKIHAYIKLSEGCNQQCSFCAIPSFKGRLHSRSMESCLKELERLTLRGYKDFSFIAQDSSSYMRDLGEKDALIRLIDEVENIKGIRSARILYLYPTTTSEALIERILDSRVFQPYFDMPLQHISDSMLSLMRRGATKRRHIELLEKMRGSKNSFIRTTFLLGHPGETQRDFEELCEFVSEFNFDRVNIFAFSKEEGTRAYDMQGAVDSKTTKERIKAINKIIISQQKKHFKSLVGQTLPCIIDGLSKESELLFSARDIRWDREIDGEILINENLSSSVLKEGYYNVEVTSYKEGYLLGKVVGEL